jgi:hypothetical protein
VAAALAVVIEDHDPAEVRKLLLVGTSGGVAVSWTLPGVWHWVLDVLRSVQAGG